MTPYEGLAAIFRELPVEKLRKLADSKDPVLRETARKVLEEKAPPE